MDIVDSVGIGVDEEIPPSLTSTVRDCCTVQVGRRVFRTMNAIKCVCVIVSEKVDVSFLYKKFHLLYFPIHQLPSKNKIHSYNMIRLH